MWPFRNTRVGQQSGHGDDVLGYLTAEKVFERIYRHYHRMPTLFPEYVIIEGETATFATGLTKVWDDLLETNDVIKKIIIPEGVTYLESGFKQCVALEDISFPSTLKAIPRRSFEDSCLKNISFSFGIESIGEYAFMGCKQLKRVHVPGSIKRISDAAFWQCSISDAILDDGIETIGYLAFAENPLKSVALPKSLKELDSIAFVDQNWEPVRIIYK